MFIIKPKGGKIKMNAKENRILYKYKTWQPYLDHNQRGQKENQLKSTVHSNYCGCSSCNGCGAGSCTSCQSDISR